MEPESGIKKLVESRKGTLSVILSIAITALGLIKGVDADLLVQVLAALGIGHSVGQGIADHGKN